MKNKRSKVVIIIPCYNEEESLPHLMAVLDKQIGKINSQYAFDVLFVNDGSKDNTQTVIEDLSRKYGNVYYREFAYNAGHQSALRAGINAATNYSAAIMMDADLQHPPKLIIKMVKLWEQGYKIVQMTREDSASETGRFQYFMSSSYYKLINAVSDIKLEYGASDFRLIDKLVIDTIVNSHEQDLFLRGYFSWLKVKRTTIGYKPNKRIAGKSKYSFKKLLNLAFQGILQFSEKPLKGAMGIGILMAALSFIYGTLISIRYFLGSHEVDGWTSLMVAMLFCFGVNFILMGIVGTYLAHSIRLQKLRPEYIIASEKLSA